MSTILGCIADDFTGATDIAGLLARSGVQVSLRIGVPTTDPKEAAAFEVIALKCRTEPAEQAIEEVLAAKDWLEAAGTQHYFWKYCSTFDSTEKGNIGTVSEALMSALGINQTIYCPAFPENGRSTYMGNHFVGVQPLSESPMKDHPLTPMRDSNLLRLLEPQVLKPVGLVDFRTVSKGPQAVEKALEALHADNVAHVVFDAICDEDLLTIASACQDMRLLTGGSAIAMPLPDLYKQKRLLDAGAMRPTPPVLDDKTIALSGSCSAMTNAQVAHYKAQGGSSFQLDPADLIKSGVDKVLTWLDKQDLSTAPLIYATAPPESVKAVQAQLGVEAAGKLVEDALAQCAVAARRKGARRFIIAGGETSGAVTKALDVNRLDIAEEIAPGVPWTYCQSNGHSIALTLKSGNFGAETFFTDAIEKLETK